MWAAALGLYTVGSAFSIANTVPTVLYTLLAGGAVSAVFVPQLVRALNRGEAEGAAYADRLLTVIIVVLGPATIGAVFAAPVLAGLYAGKGWSRAELDLAAAFLAWCLPQVFFYGVFGVLSQVLQARGRPGPMMWAPIANNVIAIAVGVVFLVYGSAETGPQPDAVASISTTEIALLGGGASLGVVVQALILVPALRTVGYRFRPRLDLRGSGLGRSARLAVWTLVFVAANQVAYSVTVVIANTAGKAAEGSAQWAAGLPTYTNAYMIMLVSHALVAVSLANARTRSMSDASVRGRAAEAGVAVGRSLRDAGRVLVPVAAATAVMAPTVTRLLFPGNPVPDTLYMGLVLACFAPSIVIYSAQFLVVRGLYVLEDTRRPALVQLLITGLQILLAVLAGSVLPPEWVVAGLAASFALAYLAGLVLSVRLLHRATGEPGLRGLAVSYGQNLIAALPAAGAAWIISRLVVEQWGPGLIAGAVALLSGAIVFCAGYKTVSQVFENAVHGENAP
ncbi:murein biosynthesis integral membrane protein MurJ [Pseudonocardia sediminis]|uniref:murein biosynthesis integral membrane protein MurJ n=1 Tax=Pseudonocardia sediminis TaxID=1397368 RepID=UPI0013EF3E3D|nr:lipid II flippase MurJ [Pseudonocardia sediminis]